MDRSANSFCLLLLCVLLSSILGFVGLGVDQRPDKWFLIMFVTVLISMVSYHRGINKW